MCSCKISIAIMAEPEPVRDGLETMVASLFPSDAIRMFESPCLAIRKVHALQILR